MTTNQPLRKRRNELDGRHGAQYYAVQNNMATVSTPVAPLVFNFNATTTVIDTLSASVSVSGITQFVSPKYSFYKVTFLIETNSVAGTGDPVESPYNLQAIATLTNNSPPAYGNAADFTTSISSITYPRLYVNNIEVPADKVSVQLGFLTGQFRYYTDTVGVVETYNHRSSIISEVCARAECVILLETGDVLTAQITADAANYAVPRTLLSNPTVFVEVFRGSTVYNAHLEISEFTRGL